MSLNGIGLEHTCSRACYLTREVEGDFIRGCMSHLMECLSDFPRSPQSMKLKVEAYSLRMGIPLCAARVRRFTSALWFQDNYIHS